jgi:hypothetical protein
MDTKAKTTKVQTAARKSSPRRQADPKQFQRFVETARKIGVDEDPEALDRAFDRIVRKNDKEDR